MDQSKVQCLRHKDAIVPPSRYRRGGAGFASTKHRVTERAATPRAAKDNYDALTGLPALASLAGTFRGLIRRARRSHSALALISFNIDEFRSVCEAFGRQEGDKAISSVASLMRAEVHPNAIIVRAGTSRFIVVLTGLTNATDAIEPVRRILDAIAQPRNVEGQDLRITASAGIATFPNDGDDYETLLRNSNAAMHEANFRCHGSLRFHSGNVALDAKRRLRLNTDLSHAIENRELALHYQPQFEVNSGRVCGVEALARWFPANGDAIEPRVFIPLAEQTGLIGALGAWVLQEACETVVGWDIPGEPPPSLSVNISTHQIDDSMCAVIRRAVERAGFPAERLELEITEGSLIRDPEAALECLRQWKELGVRIAVDDFGTGYSSFSYLSRLPVDRLKLDKSLIHSLATKGKDAAIVRSIIALGKELGVSVIAEGVETEQQFQMLRDLGCQQVQGYLMARPVPPEEVRALLMSRWGMWHAPSQGVRNARGSSEGLPRSIASASSPRRIDNPWDQRPTVLCATGCGMNGFAEY
jgi:diguanylate cyclase (GGDEF)-like protein